MSQTLFFIYDSHCPWSYASLPLVEAIVAAFPDLDLQLWHSCRYEGGENISRKTIEAVENDSLIKFDDKYVDQRNLAADSTIAANIMAWATNRSPQDALGILKTIQHEHFVNGNALIEVEDFNVVINKHKLSLPGKVLNKDKFTKDVEYILHDIEELQEVIATDAIPALLFAHNDELILLNHNLYLKEPKAIIDAIKLELK